FRSLTAVAGAPLGCPAAAEGFGSRAHLPVSEPQPFVARQLLQTHWSPCPDFVGANSDLRSHAELPAVGEARRGVPINGRGVDLVQEFHSRGFITCHDAVGMRGAIVIDVINGGFDAFYHAYV